MPLLVREVLGVSPGEIVSFIGAGGKTTLMYRLAGELAVTGKVLVTTTTKLYYPGEKPVEQVVLAASREEAVRKVAGQLQSRRVVALGTGLLPDGKIQGVPPDWMPHLARKSRADFLLVEADGAARRPLKGYAPHEPALPPASTLVVPVVGVNAVGVTLDERGVHRPQLVAAVSGASLGARVTEGVVARVLVQMVFLARKMAPDGKVFPWLNQVETPRTIAGARYISRLVYRECGIPAILGAATSQRPVREVWPPAKGEKVVAALVLAAGLSSRMTVPKTLLPLGGKTLVEYAVDHVLGARVEPVVVVLGHEAEELKGVLAGRPVGFAVNPRYRDGQAGSLREGLLALPPGVAGVVCCLGDQPLIPASVVDAVVERFLATGAPVVYPSFRGQRGNPVLFDAGLFPELLELTGDQGGRAVIARHARAVEVVATGVPGVVQDVDTWEDYTRLRGLVEAGNIPWLVE